MFQQEEFPTAASRAVRHRWERRTSPFHQFLTCSALSNSLSFSGISPSSIATLDPWTWKRDEWVKPLNVCVSWVGKSSLITPPWRLRSFQWCSSNGCWSSTAHTLLLALGFPLCRYIPVFTRDELFIHIPATFISFFKESFFTWMSSSLKATSSSLTHV